METDDITLRATKHGCRDKAGRRDSRQSDEDENLRLCGKMLIDVQGKMDGVNRSISEKCTRALRTLLSE